MGEPRGEALKRMMKNEMSAGAFLTRAKCYFIFYRMVILLFALENDEYEFVFSR